MRLWRIDFGRNIRAGSHYLPFLVYDFDGDGRAEMIPRTASGAIDGSGVIIGDGAADYRDSNGYVLAGPEFLTLFDGITGAALDTTAYTPPRGNISDWGDSYGNRVDRFQAGVAYLDGIHPSVLWAVFNGRDTGRGLAADVDPNYSGNEAWGAANLNVWSAKGEVIGQNRPLTLRFGGTVTRNASCSTTSASENGIG